MTRSQAIALARKKFPKVDCRDSGTRFASSPKKREEARAEFQRLLASAPPRVNWITDRERFPDTMTVGDLRRHVAQQAAERHAWLSARDDAQSRQWRHRYSITDVSGVFGHVVGSGDTWEEALRAAKIEIPE